MKLVASQSPGGAAWVEVVKGAIRFEAEIGFVAGKVSYVSVFDVERGRMVPDHLLRTPLPIDLVEWFEIAESARKAVEEEE